MQNSLNVEKLKNIQAKQLQKQNQQHNNQIDKLNIEIKK